MVRAPAPALLLAGCAFWNASKEAATGILVDAPIFPLVVPWEDGRPIPAEHTCDGADTSPPLQFPELPAGTTHLALVMEDPDAPSGNWVHWLWWDAPAADIAADTEPGVSGKNTWGRIGYSGPCPPAGGHRYFLHVYALDAPLGLPAGSDREAFAAALPAKAIGHAQVMGRYAR